MAYLWTVSDEVSLGEAQMAEVGAGWTFTGLSVNRQ